MLSSLCLLKSVTTSVAASTPVPLRRRTSAVSTSKAASQHARALVDEMQSRLAQEIQEREAEAALYSARLYESERQMSDW